MGILYIFGFIGLVVFSLAVWGWVKFIRNSDQFVYTETDEEETK